jgi:hypothetical protein
MGAVESKCFLKEAEEKREHKYSKGRKRNSITLDSTAMYLPSET